MQGNRELTGRKNENRSRPCETVGSRTENRFKMQRLQRTAYGTIMLADAAHIREPEAVRKNRRAQHSGEKGCTQMHTFDDVKT